MMPPTFRYAESFLPHSLEAPSCSLGYIPSADSTAVQCKTGVYAQEIWGYAWRIMVGHHSNIRPWPYANCKLLSPTPSNLLFKLQSMFFRPFTKYISGWNSPRTPRYLHPKHRKICHLRNFKISMHKFMHERHWTWTTDVYPWAFQPSWTNRPTQAYYQARTPKYSITLVRRQGVDFRTAFLSFRRKRTKS